MNAPRPVACPANSRPLASGAQINVVLPIALRAALARASQIASLITALRIK